MLNDVQPQRASLESAYRQWLLAEARREAEAGCPRILGLKNRIVVLFREVTRGQTPKDVCALMTRRIRRAKYLSVPPLDVDADTASETFRWPILDWSTLGQPQAVIDYPWRPNFALDADKVELAKLDLRIAQGEFRLSKQLIRKHFREALKALLGAPFEASGQASYWTPLGEVTVETVFEFQRRRSQPMPVLA